MGRVNDYINRIIKKINDLKINNDKPWLKYYDRMPEHIEYYKGSMYDMLLETAERYPNYTALEFFDIKYSFKEFIKRIDEVTISLKKFNIVENECVTICMPNIPEAIFLIYAVNKMGAICNIIHPLSTTNDIKNALDETNSSILFVTDVSYDNVKDIKVDNLVVCEVSNSMNGIMKTLYNLKNKKNYNENVIKWNDFLKKNNKYIKTHVSRTSNDPAVIIYSGGTTGKSKGIILSNLCFNSIAEHSEVICKEAKPGNSMLSALPIFHGFGLAVGIHAPLVLGLKCILVPKINISKINKLIRDKKPTILPAIPSMLNAIVNNKFLGSKSFKSVKIILSGGDYLSDELREKTEKFFNKCGSEVLIQIGYGLSEATAFVSATNQSMKDINNIGVPNPDNIIKIFEPYTDVEKEYGDIGEICVKGPSLMLGYINQDEETANVLKTHFDGDVWLHTGDLGYMSEDGILHYTSRLKRMIISNGYNIYPLELEEIINKCKYVDSSTVVGIKHKVKQEVPKAVIVLKKEYEISKEIEKEIKEYCKKNIAKYAIPYEYEFRSSLPTTKIGKIDYRSLEQKKDN